ncbi:hypothetical protein KI387_005517, partial [Taxus chinensis]
LVQQLNGLQTMKENGVVQWEKTEVNVDDHVFVPHFPPHLTSYDEYVEEYVADMHLKKLSPSRPLWEFHFLNYKTTNGEATVIVNIHHMLGDGASLLALASACSAGPHNSTLPQTLIIPPSTPQVHKRSLETTWFGFDGIYRLCNMVFTVVLVMWYTLHDLITTFSRFKWVEDSRFPIRGHPGVEMLPKVMASNTFKLRDIREIKNRVGGTVNDVVMGVVFYGFRLYCQMDLTASARALYNTLANTTLSVTNVNGPTEQLSFTGYKVENAFFSMSGVPQIRIKQFVKDLWRYQMDMVVVYVSYVIDSTRAMYNTLANTTVSVKNVNGLMDQLSFIGYKAKIVFFSVSDIPQPQTIIDLRKTLRQSRDTQITRTHEPSTKNEPQVHAKAKKDKSNHELNNLDKEKQPNTLKLATTEISIQAISPNSVEYVSRLTILFSY